MLIPRRTKWCRQHHPGRSGYTRGGIRIAFGKLEIQALEGAYLTSYQTEATRTTAIRYAKRDGEIWINIFPDHPSTKKPVETRMGSGKGPVKWWVAPVKPGHISLEIGGISEELACEVLSRAQHKLPIETRFITRGGGG